MRGRRGVSGPQGRRMGCRRWAGIPRRCVGRGVRRSLLWAWEVVAPIPRRAETYVLWIKDGASTIY